jgi:hypothetical protein
MAIISDWRVELAVILSSMMGSFIIEIPHRLGSSSLNHSLIHPSLQERDVHSLHLELGWYSYVRFSNATGHYELNLAQQVHCALAGRLKVGCSAG